MKPAPNDIRKIKIGNDEIVIDPAAMQFSDATLSEFMQHVYGWIDYFGRKLADAEALVAMRKKSFDVAYNEKFAELKEQGGVVALCEAKAKSDMCVVSLREDVIAAQQNVDLLYRHLRAWDIAHQNAQSRGHFMRKEMDKLRTDIYVQRDPDLDNKIDDIIGTAESYKADAQQQLSDENIRELNKEIDIATLGLWIDG